MIWKKYIKIKALGTIETEGIFDGKVVVQEKVDGANFCFFLNNNELTFASRNRVMVDKKDSKGWNAILPVIEAYGLYKDKFSSKYLYIGESLQRHTIKYNDDVPGFIGYDVWNTETELFLSWKEAKEEFESIGLEFIHIHFERDGSKISIEELEECIKNSAYKDGSAEGVVLKNYSRLNKFKQPLFAKIVTDEFKEKNKLAFGGSNQPPKESNSTKLISLTYGTNARIEKTIHKLSDEGYKIDMSLIPVLFNAVAEDIFLEHSIEIYKDFDRINFKELRRLIAKQCVPVVKRVLLKRAK